ncbi:MAG: chemotaxis protein CheC [Firmicutes bacterium]|nr:chemotaxis protein CheC [Bacillota bacterium]
MTIIDYDNLTSIQMDALKEIGNVGSGNAAVALSQILNHTVKMDVPTVEILGYEETMNMLGGPEEIASAVLVELVEGMNGMMLFIQQKDFLGSVLNTLLSKELTSFEEMDEMDASAIMEVGNILLSSYVTAISNFAGFKIDISVPAHTVNMIGGILSVPIVEMAEETEKMLMIHGYFIIDGQKISSNILLIPDMGSLNKLLESLGVN